MLLLQVKRQRRADLARIVGPVKIGLGPWSLAFGQNKKQRTDEYAVV